MIQKEKLCVTCSTKNSPTHAASTFLNATPKRKKMIKRSFPARIICCSIKAFKGFFYLQSELLGKLPF